MLTHRSLLSGLLSSGITGLVCPEYSEFPAGMLNFRFRLHHTLLSYDTSVSEEVKQLFSGALGKVDCLEEFVIEDEDEFNLVIKAHGHLDKEFLAHFVLPYAEKVRILNPPFLIDRLLTNLIDIAHKYEHYNDVIDNYLLRLTVKRIEGQT